MGIQTRAEGEDEKCGENDPKPKRYRREQETQQRREQHSRGDCDHHKETAGAEKRSQRGDEEEEALKDDSVTWRTA